MIGARYYDATLGRFLSPDPIGHAGGLNLYGYCGNDPVNTVDPSGLAPTWEDVGAGILNAGPTAAKWAWKQWMKLWQVKLHPSTPTFGNANPDSPTARALLMRGGEISDGLDEMGGIVVSGVASGAMMAIAAGGAGCTGGGRGFGGGGGGGGRVNPWRVRYTQDSVSWNFSTGETIGDTGYALRIGKLVDTPPIRIFVRDGNYYSIDNRRLLAYRVAGRDTIPYRWATPDEIAGRQFTTQNNGSSVSILMPPPR